MDINKGLILAGDHYHDPNIAFEGIGAVLKDERIKYSCTSDYASFGKESIAEENLLIFHRDGVEFPDRRNSPVPWMTLEQEEFIEQFVLSGGGFLALHNSAWDYPWKNGYRRTLGGYYIGHPPIADFNVDVVNKTHPVTAGVESYEITDEQHFLYFDYDRVEILLVSQGQDGRQSVSGWAHEYGKGRVVYLPHGHSLKALMHPCVQKLLHNAVKWLLGKDGE